MTLFSNINVPHLSDEALDKAVARLEEIYARVADQWPGFVAREGQVQMIRSTLETLLHAKTAEHPATGGSNLGALEAGTGTGKTLAYCLAAFVASEALGLRVVVSTATVTLQEQLYLRDLPRLAELIPELKFELLKGRSRYVCKSRLDSAITGDLQGDWLDDADTDDEALPDDAQSPAPAARPVDEKTIVWLKSIQKGLDSGKWNGEIDNLPNAPDDQDWQRVQADANACNNVRCSYYKECSFFNARRKAEGVQLQVANHALVLSALANDSSLFDAKKTMFIFDEGHHLPEIANDQFSHQARIGQSQKVLISLRKAVVKGSKLLETTQRPDLPAYTATTLEAQRKLAWMEKCLMEAELVNADNPIFRFKHGVVEDEVAQECDQLSKLLQSLHTTVGELRGNLGNVDDSMAPKVREQRAAALNAISAPLQRMESLLGVFASWATHDAIPLAKWIEWVEKSPSPDAVLCSSPMTAAQGLSTGLWGVVAASVCTSATLTACGSFDYFQRLSGLNRYRALRTGIMQSPFDYQTQGQLRMPALKNTPKDAGFSDELCARLPGLMENHQNGQLVLFTSRRQMDTCYAALPEDLRRKVLVQGAKSRQSLLQAHKDKIEAGQPSVIFGLQSMGEGLDLPGKLCEHVVIDKLPFKPPTAPVEAALAEWLTTQGRDPFNELVIPRTSMQLAQWVGRGVRTVTDFATITICDTRLWKARYGQRILAGLPAFKRVEA